MAEETKTKFNRKWVIKAGVAFLIIMAILTFFSNTIMNYSLPEVRSAYPGPAQISASIKGSGTITANKQEKIVAAGEWTIAEVKVALGDAVKKGDVIATLVTGSEESQELKDAKKALEELEKAQERKRLENQKQDKGNYSAEIDAINAATDSLNEANANLAKAQSKAGAIDAANAAVRNAEGAVAVAQGDVSRVETDLSNLIIDRDSKQASVDQLQAIYNEKEANGEDTTKAKALLDQAQIELENIQTAVTQKEEEKLTAQGNLDRANGDLESANNQLSEANALPELKDAQKTVNDADKSLKAANKALADRKKADGIDSELEQMTNAEERKAIEEAQKKVDELTAVLGQSAVTAPEDGTISLLDITAGQKVPKDQDIAAIDLAQENYRITISLPVAQAKDLKVGQTGRVDLYIEDDTATITAIKVDPNDPTNTRNVTFSIKGTFFPGQTATVSLVNQTRQYDAVIPSSAIHEDSASGKFVYAMIQRSSPLGTRYSVLKVPVQILATDGTNTAVEASDLAGREVITMSTKPLEDGTQVRLAYS